MKLEIIKGKTWNADFTVVSDDGVTPEVLDVADTATFTVSTAGEDSTIIIDSVAMTVVDGDNGKFNVLLTAEQTALLDGKVGFEEDRYPTMSEYIGLLDFTLVAGDRYATSILFVRDIGVV